MSGEDSLILRKDIFEPCLVLYPQSVWNERMDTLRQRLSRWNRRDQMIYRQFVTDVETITLDGNGRFLIPKRYMKMANIEQQIRFTGMDDCIEIWATGSEEQPFMSAEEFSKAMEETMGTEDFLFPNNQSSATETSKSKVERSMIKTAETYHCTVLLNESIEGLNLHTEGTYVDVTFGGGGHSREILSRLKGSSHLYSFDQDVDAEENINKMGLEPDQIERFTFIRSNFRYLKTG